MTVRMDDVLGVLGKIHVDESVKQVVVALGLDPSKIRLKRGDVDINIVSKSHGLEIEFADITKYRGGEDFPEGALVAGAIFVSPASIETLGELPHGIDFALSRESAQDLLGKPDWSSPVAPIDRWNKDSRDITIRFDRSSGKAQRIIFSLPKQHV